jgi:hypothetical protein
LQYAKELYSSRFEWSGCGNFLRRLSLRLAFALVEFVDMLALVKYVFKDISHLLYLTYFTYLLNEITAYYKFLSVNPNLGCSGIYEVCILYFSSTIHWQLSYFSFHYFSNCFTDFFSPKNLHSVNKAYFAFFQVTKCL